jgi:hypothetical protein
MVGHANSLYVGGPCGVRDYDCPDRAHNHANTRGCDYHVDGELSADMKTLLYNFTAWSL